MNKKDKEEIIAEIKKSRFNGNLRFFLLAILITGSFIILSS